MNTFAVNHRVYEILEESEPYFLGRWFEKEVDGISHMATTTDGAQVYFMTEGCTSFTLHFTDITHIRVPYYAYTVDGSEPVRRRITAPTVSLPDSGSTETGPSGLSDGGEPGSLAPSCGCSTGGSASPLFGLGLAALALISRRRLRR
jgi:MYXO-CTERM domain-containing protein